MYQFILEGLNCMSCVNHIKEELEELEPDMGVTINLMEQEVLVKSKLSLDKVKTSLENMGYTVTKAEQLT